MLNGLLAVNFFGTTLDVDGTLYCIAYSRHCASYGSYNNHVGNACGNHKA